MNLLVEDLARVPSDFEKFGYRFMDRFHPADWDHRGTNVTGAPVKSVVDSMTGTTKAAEYSTDKSYFTDDKHAKLMGDVAHVHATHPTAKHAWMLSTMLATGGQMTRAREFVAKSYPDMVVEILDSRRIAEFIVGNIDNDAFLSDIEGYLPVLSTIRSEWALSHQIPLREGYLDRSEDEAALEAALRDRSVVVVSGVSGLGKSTLVAAVAERLRAKGEYELVLWQDAERLTSDADLGAVFVNRFGERANLLGYLERRECLLVLDNLSVDDLPQRIASRAPKTHILATSQVAARGPAAFRLGDLDRTLARKLLTRGLPDCPDDVFEAVHASVGGHPLILSLLNGLVAEEGGRWELAREYGEDVNGLEDERRQRVCERVLTKHRSVLERELRIVRWCDAPVIDVCLLRELGGSLSQDKLARRHFVSGATQGTVRVNELVFASVRALVREDADVETGFVETLSAFVERSVAQERGDGRLEFARLARVHRELIARVLGDDTLTPSSRAALRYAYAVARDRTTVLALLGDPLADAVELRRSPPSNGLDMRVRAIIETIEATYSVLKLKHDDKAARAHHRTLLPAFGNLAKIDGLSARVAAELEFHRCKALAWAGDYEEAEAALRVVLKTDADAFAARVQLGRLLMARARKDQSAADEAVEHFQAIVAAPRGAVSVPIVLAGFEMLRRLPAQRLVTLVRDNRARLTDALSKAVGAGLQQAFGVVAALGSVLWYQAEDLFDELLGVIAEGAMPGTDGKESFDWAQLQKSRAKMMRKRGAEPGEVTAVLRGAIVSYEQTSNLGEWERVQFAEALILADEPKRALQVLDAVAERSMHWYHRCAQAHVALGALAAARSAIDSAVSACGEDTTFAPTVLRERFQIRQLTGDVDAIVDLRQAHALATGQYRDELAAELKRAGEGPPPNGRERS